MSAAITLGVPLGSSFLLFPSGIKDSDGNTIVAPPPPPPKVPKATSKSKPKPPKGHFRDSGTKWNTLILTGLPGTWFNLDATSNDWVDDASSYREPPSSINSLETFDSIKTRLPFVNGLKGIFGEYGAIKNLDVMVHEGDDNNAGDDVSVMSGATNNAAAPRSDEFITNRPNSPMLERYINSRPGTTGDTPLAPSVTVTLEGGGGTSDLIAGFKFADGSAGDDDSYNALDMLKDDSLAFGMHPGEGQQRHDGDNGEEGDSDNEHDDDEGGTVLDLIDSVMDGVDPDTAENVEGEAAAAKQDEEGALGEASDAASSKGKVRPLPETPKVKRPLPAIPTGDTSNTATATTNSDGGGNDVHVERRLSPLPQGLYGQKFDLYIQYNKPTSFLAAMSCLTSNAVLCKGEFNGDIAAKKPAEDDSYFVFLDIDFDVDGYFSSSRMDYRERQEMDRRKVLLKEQLVRAKMEKVCGRKARESVRKCEVLLESLEGDVEKVESNEVVMRHRPTSVSAAGAKAALESARGVVRKVKCSMLPKNDEELNDMLSQLRKCISHARGCVKQCVALSDKVIMSKTMSLPTFEQALEDNGCSLFLRRCKECGYSAESLLGCTILVPEDDAFLGEGTETFEEECFDVHIIDGPYMAGDLLTLNGGYTQPRSEDNKHSIRTRMDLGGIFTFWLAGDMEPRRKISALKPDVCVKGGTVFHIVDRILYASDTC
jgi:hypothetical protein